MMAEIASNFSWAAMFLMATTGLNIVGMGLLIYSSRLNLKTARTLAEIAKLRSLHH